VTAIEPHTLAEQATADGNRDPVNAAGHEAIMPRPAALVPVPFPGFLLRDPVVSRGRTGYDGRRISGSPITKSRRL
jgi:hypothetical protein